jgi:hypothetical protein
VFIGTKAELPRAIGPSELFVHLILIEDPEVPALDADTLANGIEHGLCTPSCPFGDVQG